MRLLDRPLALSLGFLLTCVLAPSASKAQTAQDPQYPAQPGYQPPQGYPQQQPYPQQGYPQQGYPQQGYPQPSPPPPGYYAPPPGYAPEPGYAPPPNYVSTEPAFRRGFLAMPFIGVHSVVGSFGDGYDAGLRFGTLLGWHVNEQFSMNAEFSFDFMNVKNAPSGYSQTMFDLAFSPLFHIPSGNLEIVLGPKLGAFGLSTSTYYDPIYGGDTSYSASGLAYGFNFGVLGGIGNMAMGGMFNFTGRHVSSVCTTVNGNEQCGDPRSSMDDIKTIAFNGVLLF